MQLSVLDDDRKLAGERREQRRLVVRKLTPAREVGGEQADQLLSGDERHREHRVDLRLVDGLVHRCEAKVGLRVRDVQHSLRTERAERQLEQPLGDGELRARHPLPRLGPQSRPLTQVHGHALRAQQLGNPRDGGLQRVRKRELGGRLADNGQQCLRALELERHRLRALAGAQGLGCPHGERGESVDLCLRGARPRRKGELENAHRRLAEREARHCPAVPVAVGLEPHRLALGEGATGPLLPGECVDRPHRSEQLEGSLEARIPEDRRLRARGSG